MLPDFLTAFSDIVRLVFAGLIDLFTNERTGPLLAGILIVLGAAFLAYVVWEWLRFRLIIRGAISAVRLAKGTDETERMASFLRNYATIDGKLFSIFRVRSSWREFRETLIIPRQDGVPRNGAGIISNSSRPQVFFNPTALHMNYSFARHVPNIFVGLGLLGTFIGLIAALTAALGTLGAVGSDPALAQEAIRKLLTTAAAKFYVSAAALGVSIILTVAVRACSSSTARAIARFNNALEERLFFATSERIALQQLDALQEQTLQLQTFSTDLAMSIGQSVREAISASNGALVERLEGIASSFSALVEASRLGAGEAIRGAVTDTVAATLRETTQTFQTIAEGLTTLPSRLEQAMSSLEKVGESSAAAHTLMAQNLQETATTAMRDVSTALGAEIAKSSSSVMEQLERSAGVFHEGAAGVAAVLTGFSDGGSALAESLRAAGRESASIQQQLVESALALATSTDRVRSASDTLGARLEAVTESVRDLASTSGSNVEAMRTAQDSIRSSVEALSDQWARHVSRFDDVDENLAKVFSAITDQITAQTEQMQEQIQHADVALARAVTNLEALVESLVDAKE